MKPSMKSGNIMIVALLALAAAVAAFWFLALSPKREEAKKLGARVEKEKASLSQHRAEVAQALEAREEFPADYRQLVVLGKAVPGGDDTPSLLVQLDQIAKRARVKLSDFQLEAGGGEAPASAAPEAAAEGGAGTPVSTPVSPTEAAASLLPLGATIGPAGLGVMPYTLAIEGGDFFKMADFIEGLDSLVKTQNAKVSVDGRLITVDSFSLAPNLARGFPALQATFEVTTYLTPPSQGVTAGATPATPAPATATPASTTTGGAP